MSLATTPRAGRVSRRWLAMGALTLALITIGLDATVLNLALPTLSKSLGASESQLQWFVTAYTLALAAAMVPAGLLGDRYGRKTVLVGALAVFGICRWHALTRRTRSCSSEREPFLASPVPRSPSCPYLW